MRVAVFTARSVGIGVAVGMLVAVALGQLRTVIDIRPDLPGWATLRQKAAERALWGWGRLGLVGRRGVAQPVLYGHDCPPE